MIRAAIGGLSRWTPYLRLKPFDTTDEAGRSKERYRKAALTSISSGLSKVVSVIAGLVSVRLTLHYLGSERYGLWMTISSVIAMLAFSDLGINNSLLNGISKANGRDDTSLAKAYVSSAFFLLGVVVTLLATIFAIAYRWIPWSALFRLQSWTAQQQAGPAVAVFVGCFLLTMIAGIGNRIQTGYQEGFIANLWTTLGSVLSLIALVLVIHLQGSLAMLVLAMAGAPVFALLLNCAVLFGRDHPQLRPSWSSVRKPVVAELVRVGGLFLILQISVAVAFSSDNIVITRILGPMAVTQYAVPNRLFSLIVTVAFFLLTPLWPAYGEALERADYAWIRKTFMRSIGLATFVPAILSVILVAFGSRLIRFWVGPSIHPTFALLLGLGLWGILNSVSTALAMFMNGLTIIRFQVVMSSIAGLGNIGLSIYFTRRIGIAGVVYGSIVSQVLLVLLPCAIYLPRYMRRFASADRPSIQDTV